MNRVVINGLTGGGDTGDEWPVGAEGLKDGPFGSNLYL